MKLYDIFYDDYEPRWQWIVIVVISCAVSGVYGLATISHHITAPGDQAEVEQVQADLKSLEVCDTDTRDRIIYLNTRIRSRQRYNSIWFFDLIIPDSWDEMTPLKLENTACYKNTELRDYNLAVDGLKEAIEALDK